MEGRCTSCHQPLLPAEPIYDLQLCAVLIPCSPGALRTFLWRNRAGFPARYRLDPERRRRRVLTPSEVDRARRHFVRGWL